MGGPKVTARREESSGGVPVNDVAGLARHVLELDPSKYVDEQAKLAYEEARVKWPVLAKLMGLDGSEHEEAAAAEHGIIGAFAHAETGERR